MNESGTQPQSENEIGDDRPLDEQLEEAGRYIAELESQREDEHTMFESALDHNPVGVVIFDTDGSFRYANPAAQEIWGGFTDADGHEDWAEFNAYHSDGTPYTPEDWPAMTALREGKTVEPQAIEIERFDGRRSVILGSASPFYGPDGELRGVIGTLADITELKQLEEAERKARQTAERAASRMTDLQEVTTALFDALTPQEAIEIAMDRASDLLDADRGAGFLVAEGRDAIEVVARRNYGGTLDDFETIPMDAPVPLAETIRLGTGIFYSGPDEYARRYPNLVEHDDITPSTAVATLPLLADGEAFGSLVLSYLEPREFDEHDRAFLQTLAGQCAQAVRRAQLYRDEQRARAEAERAHRRQKFISEASAILSSTIDYDELLERVANLAVPEFADWCAVDLVGPEHSVTDPVAIAHVDPDKVELAYEYRREYPPDPEMSGAVQVLQTGESQVLERLDEATLEALARDEKHFEYLRKLGLASAIVVPMTVRDRTLGAMTFVSAHQQQFFDDADLETAEELARRAAMAIDNAELHRESERARRRLSQKADQQKAVSRLARHALDADLEELFDEALEMLVDLLDADTAKLMELREDSTLVLRAGIGWRDEWMGANLGPPDEGTAIGYALLENEVVVVEDLSDAERGPTELVTAHELESAMTVQVPGRLRPFGAIGVHSDEPRTFTDEDSEFIRGISNVLSDAIEKDRAQRQREATYRRLAEAMRDRQELLSVVSHDLRSPASAVRMNLELIRRHLDADDPNSDQIRESVESAEGSIDRMVEMMSDLLEVARDKKAERRKSDYERVDFGDLVRSVVADFDTELDQSGSPITLELEEGVRGRTDRVRFEQIVGNLVSNAVKYGEGNPIEITLATDDEQVDLRVRDHGVGIPPEHQDQIFERFHRIEGEEETDSFGLGLWIVKRSVDALDGTIICDSERGEGTEFRVTLPIQPDE